LYLKVFADNQKLQRSGKGVASSAHQLIQLPSSEPSPDVSQVACGIETAAGGTKEVPTQEFSATEKLALFRPHSSSSDPAIPVSSTTSLALSLSSSLSSYSPTAAESPLTCISTAAAIFTTEYYEARPSAKGGIGAFAIKEIPEGTVILAEEPLMLANIMEVYHAYDSLTFEERKLFRSLYSWRGVNPEPIMAIFQTNRYIIMRSRVL